MEKWNSKQYLKFKAERTQPSIDLKNRINFENPQNILDLGCGPGNSSAILRNEYENADILGIDFSENMIKTAKEEHKNIDFKVFDATKSLSSLGKTFDIVFSNACIQWIPNHKKLFENVYSVLNDGGVFAVQTPMSYEQQINKIIAEVSTKDKWKNRFESLNIVHNLTQSEYYDLLSDMFADFSMWQTNYFHKMKSHQDIVEWYKGTRLRPYLDALSNEEKQEFEKDILERVIEEYPVQKNGEIIFRFPRFFFVAIK